MLPRIRHGRLTVCVLAIFAAMFAATSFNAPAASAQQQEIDLGATVYLAPGQNIGQSVAQLEALTQRDLDVIRVFLLWDSPWPGAQLNALRDSGHTIYLSVRSNNLNGTKVPWSEITNAQPGSVRHNEMVAWANRVRDFGDDMYFAFHHEPENRDSIANGTSAEYIAAWRKVVNTFRAQGASNVEYAWTMTEYAFEVPFSDRRSHLRWYPGDAWVDHLAADAYNWADCRPEINNPWRSLERQIRDFVEFGATKPDKGLMLAELATFENLADPTLKAQWIEDARELFKQPEYDQFHTIAWYNHPQAGYPNCDWQVDTSQATLDAWRALAADPFYGGGGSVNNGAPVVVSSCWAAVTGNSASVTWTRAASDNAARFVIERRRNGGTWFWLARVNTPGTSYVDSNRVAGSTYEYRVKTQSGAAVNSAPRVCGGSVNTGAPVAPLSCSVEGTGTSVNVFWGRASPDNAVRFVIERQRDGGTWFWMGRVENPANSIIDNNRVANANYTYRVKAQSASQVNSTPTVCN